MPIIDRNVDVFLLETRVAVLATVQATGAPLLTPIWFTWSEGSAHMFTKRSSSKWRNIEMRPHAALCVDHKHPPYRTVTLYGTIREVHEPFYDVIHAMAVRYYGQKLGAEFARPYLNNPPETVLFKLTPDRIIHDLDS